MSLILFREYTQTSSAFFLLSSGDSRLLFRGWISGVFENGGREDKVPPALLKYFHRRLHSKRPMDVYGRDVSQSDVAIPHISAFRAIVFATFV